MEDTTNNRKKKITKILRLRDLKFYRRSKEIDVHNNNELHAEDSIIITFNFQKN